MQTPSILNPKTNNKIYQIPENIVSHKILAWWGENALKVQSLILLGGN